MKTTLSDFNKDECAAGVRLFRQSCDFIKGVVSVNGLPNDGVMEIAFAGRSNVGKSSLFNALVNQKSLARTSNTPGRTRELNFFRLGPEILYFVDMPGYGYARASKDAIAGWTSLIHDYLKGRAVLLRVYLLIDARHGVKEADRKIMSLLNESAVSYQLVLTKCDKLNRAARDKMIEQVGLELRLNPAAFPTLIATSARKKDGIDQLRAAIADLAGRDI